jgi:hypothetical protein
MAEYSFPLGAAHALIERLAAAPPRSAVRRWVLRDDNQQHYHGLIPLRDDPVIIELRWKVDARSQEQVVGIYRLHLAALLAAGHIRREGEGSERPEVRVRFHRGERGVVSLQVNADGPALPVGTVDASLG